MIPKSAKPIILIFAITFLLWGTVIYVLYRPLDLYMFKPFEFTNTLATIEHLRSLYTNYVDADIPEWVIYNLPDGLWLLSYMFVIDIIWNSEEILKTVFLWIVPILIVCHELLQLLDVIRGTWDVLDLLFYSLAICMYLLIKNIVYVKKEDL